MAHDEIIALLEALCERPFAEDPASDPAVLRALCREAAVVLATDAGVVPSPRETEQLTASLAALIAGRGSDEERAVLIDALSRSAELRLDAESAHGFVDRLERAPRTAPADLVDEVLAEDVDAQDDDADDTGDDGERHDNVVRFAAAAAAPATAARAPAREAGVRVPPPRMWPKAIAACAVLAIAGGAAFTIDWPSAWRDVNGALRPARAPVSAPASAPAQAEPVPAPPPAAAAPPQETRASRPAGDSLDALGPAAPAALPASGALSLVPAEPSSDGSPSLDANTLRAAAGRVRGEAKATDAPPPQPVATIAVTGKPAQPCLPDVNAATAGAPATPSSPVIAARVDVDAAPPATQCDTAPTDRFADRPAGSPDAARPSVKTRRVLRPALTAAPVDDAMRQLVAPTPLAGRPPPDASESAPAPAAATPRQ